MGIAVWTLNKHSTAHPMHNEKQIERNDALDWVSSQHMQITFGLGEYPSS